MLATRLGRNDTCPCGSGRKYKKCCLPRQSGTGPTFRAPAQPGTVPGIRLDDPGLEAFEHKDVLFVKGKGWTHESELKPGDQYRLKGGGWETVPPERVIGTTFEHPFYSQERGWTPAGLLQPGEMIRTEDGWVPVKSVEDTGRYETVYNLQVEDYHTYFVGAPDWGFSVWTHNMDCGVHWTSAKSWERIVAEGRLRPSNNNLLWLEFADSLGKLKDVLRGGGKLTGAASRDVAIITDLTRIGAPRIAGKGGGRAYLLPQGMQLSGEGGRGLTWWWNTGSNAEIKKIADMIRELRRTF